MSWTLLIGVALVLGLALAFAFSRRAELSRMHGSVKRRELAVRHGAEAQLQYPVIDLSRCLGCGTCVAVCPEEGVLELVHGQATVVSGARCVGTAACERECPVSAITVTLGNLEEREDIPALTGELEAKGSPGLFLAGEVTAHALIKVAIEHGTSVAAEVAKRVGQSSHQELDLCIVGAGPAGLACALEARRHGLEYVILEQEGGLGGTVSKYPRRKLVMTQPVDLPLHGRMKRQSYSKEELMILWQEVAAEHQLSIRYGEVYKSVERQPDGRYQVRTEKNSFTARHVCLAIGRRGIPRTLGVPGENLPKVSYSLIDAHSFQGRRILVVGGGDSAVEAAIGLAEQPGNEVTLSYRKEGFFRLRSKIETRLEQVIRQGRIKPVFQSEVVSIHPDSVDLSIQNGHGPQTRRFPNDDVFVMVGGVPPIDLLKHSGVSFDKEHHDAPDPVTEEGTGLVKALTIGFCLSLIAVAWAMWHSDYYSLPAPERATHPKHVYLRPGLAVGLWLGIASAVLICVNLLYLARRSPGVRFRLGSLRLWMTSHVATGILAFLCAMLHGAMTPRNTPGGYAFWSLVVLMITGAIGRYFYAWVPRAANGRELELAEVKASLESEGEGTGQQFRERARAEVTKLIDSRWKGTFFGRLLGLLGVRRSRRQVLARITEQGRQEGIPEDQVQETLALARRAHRSVLVAGHYEDLRSLLNSWRYLHRWVAVLMVVFVVVHLARVMAYGSVFFDGGAG